MPASPLARSLIKLADAPLAAPSANASTRPSPTSAQHVADDLNGRIEVILDDGEICGVGVESTVVDGLCSPPVVLRPGGVGIEELRQIPGWEKVEKAYRDGAESGASAPRAPGMKYKHYSPRAKVVLYEAGAHGGEGFRHEDFESLVKGEEKERTIGFIRTGGWPLFGGLACLDSVKDGVLPGKVREGKYAAGEAEFKRVLDIDLGRDVKGVAQGLFSALRELDREGADVIYVEGVGDGDDIAAAVMNRLRKAASVIRS
jgi:L-threonylcarbamoyladenylate synthase